MATSPIPKSEREKSEKSEHNKQEAQAPTSVTSSITSIDAAARRSREESNLHIIVQQVENETNLKSAIDVMVRSISSRMRLLEDDKGAIDHFADELMVSGSLLADAVMTNGVALNVGQISAPSPPLSAQAQEGHPSTEYTGHRKIDESQHRGQHDKKHEKKK